ncbi:MAG TPA: sce7726 family protein [Bacillota bacterium]|nr:sce7726 family protein [Bacillota bacterium]
MKIYDRDIRRLLLNEIARKEEFISDPNCVVVHEMDVCFGCARIDIAVINGQIHGYEIKSECDNLERLTSQRDYYNKIFDTITLVISEDHYFKAVEIIPKWWGLYCITKSNVGASLKIMRSPGKNNQIKAFYLTQVLWKEELCELLKLNGLSKGIRNKTRYELGKIASQRVENKNIASFVRDKLKNRKSWKALQLRQICDDLHLLQPN